MLRSFAAALLVAFASPAPAGAAPPFGLELPVACAPGTDCWLVRYMDHAPGPQARDYRCGVLTGDAHKGTDIAIRDLARMAQGVEVRAAAPGVVDALRDGMEDVSVAAIGSAAIAGRECGNGIRIDHGEGWTTWYCHLRRSSIRVKEGDRVAAGQPIALVGMSGEASFPHLHFDLRRGEEIVDPFVGLEDAEDCAAGARPFWSKAVLARLAYAPVVLPNAGFATTAPEMEDVQRGYHQEKALPATSPALILWFEAYWVAAGDRVTFRIEDAAGQPVLEHVTAIEDDKAHWLGFAGERRPDGGWPAGVYRGEVVLERMDGGEPQRTSLERQVEIR